MPFESEKQRRFMWAKHPDIAKRWAHKYPESNKNLPMYAHDDKDKSDKKAVALAALNQAIQHTSPNIVNEVTINTAGDNVKAGNSGMVKVDIPHSDKPTYSGEEREKGELDEEGNPKSDGKPAGTGPEAVSAIFGKLSAVLAKPFREMIEMHEALAQGRDPRFVPQNLGVRRYSIPSPTIAPPMGMTTPTVANPTPQPVQQPGNAQQNTSVGGGSNPQHNPIQAFGPLGAKGQLNGNAAFGVKNSPDSLKTAAAIKAALGGNDHPNWYGAEGLIQGRDGGYRYGVEHGVDVRDKAPGWLTRMFDRDPYVLREDVPKYKKRLKALKGLQVTEEPYRLNFSHAGQLKPEMRQMIESALAKHAGHFTKISNPSPSILDDQPEQAEKISIEVQQGGLPTRAVASTIGHLNALPAAIVTPRVHQNPSNWQGAGGSLFTTELAKNDTRGQAMKSLAESMARARPDALGNTRVYLGGPRLLPEMYRGFTNPRTGIAGKALSTLNVPVAWAMTPFARSNAYNPFTDSVYQYGNSPAILSHELGHAIDFNKQPLAKSMLGRQWQGLKRDVKTLSNLVPGANLFTEAAANRESLRAIQDAYKGQPGKLAPLLNERQRTLPAAYASYLGGNVVGGVQRLNQAATRASKLLPHLAPKLEHVVNATNWATPLAVPITLGSMGAGKLYGMIQAARNKTSADNTTPWERGHNFGLSRGHNHYADNMTGGALAGALAGLAHEGLRKKTEEEEQQSVARKALRYLAMGTLGGAAGAGAGGGVAALTLPSYLGLDKSADSGAWTRAEGKNPEGGLNAKGRASLKAQGHDIKAPVTESKPTGERAKRQNSFCSRMCGMKRVNTGAKTKSDPDSRINKSLRKWNCKCGSAQDLLQIARNADS